MRVAEVSSLKDENVDLLGEDSIVNNVELMNM